MEETIDIIDINEGVLYNTKFSTKTDAITVTLFIQETYEDKIIY
jgi:hypothetical protein